MQKSNHIVRKLKVTLDPNYGFKRNHNEGKIIQFLDHTQNGVRTITEEMKELVNEIKECKKTFQSNYEMVNQILLFPHNIPGKKNSTTHNTASNQKTIRNPPNWQEEPTSSSWENSSNDSLGNVDQSLKSISLTEQKFHSSSQRFYPEIQCRYCFRQGHYVSDCRTKKKHTQYYEKQTLLKIAIRKS